jgi:hypothetical protein
MIAFGVSEDLRGVLKAEFLPVIWGIRLPFVGGYGSELVIKHHVKLGGSDDGAQV